MTTITEQELVEVMARAADPLAFVDGSPLADREAAIEAQRAALSAIRAAGWKLTPPPAASHMKGQSND